MAGVRSPRAPRAWLGVWAAGRRDLPSAHVWSESLGAAHLAPRPRPAPPAPARHTPCSDSVGRSQERKTGKAVSIGTMTCRTYRGVAVAFAPMSGCQRLDFSDVGVDESSRLGPVVPLHV